MTIQELEKWFAAAPVPQMPIYLHASIKVNDYEDFVNSHFIGIHAAPNDRLRQPLLDRLLDFKLIMEANM